jgi:hypothetical protein
MDPLLVERRRRQGGCGREQAREQDEFSLQEIHFHQGKPESDRDWVRPKSYTKGAVDQGAESSHATQTIPAGIW